ncbi:MAG: hypothetical protein IT161_23660 [Bryobacterales bacterium]|nr:hypothetical protein [Bryobacterales bacterium]
MLLWNASGATAVLDEQRWQTPDGGLVTFDPAVIADVTREVFEGFLALPKRGLEVGGILFGRAAGPTPGSIQIDGFEPVPCEHQHGPSYVFSDRDRERVESIVAGLRQRGASIAGWYRSYTGRDMALDDADRDLIREYFAGQRFAYLLLRPVTIRQCVMDLVYLTGEEYAAAPAPRHTAFAPVEAPAPIEQASPVEAIAEIEAGEAYVGAPVIEPAAMEEPVPAEPGRQATPPLSQPMAAEARGQRGSWLLWCVALLALAASGVSTYLWWQVSQRIDSAPATAAALPPLAPSATPAAPPESPAPAVQPPPAEAPASDAKVAVPAQAINQVEPHIPDGVRARISGQMEVPLRVSIDRTGRVTRVQAPEQGDSLYQFVSNSAIKAVRQTRFQPAKGADGKPVASVKTVVFTVEGAARTQAGLR